jgi:hypothetical protein
MILVPQKFVFLATPRTASRTLKEMIRTTHDETKESREHHIHPEDIFRDFPEARDIPRYALIREPYDQVLSWFHHAIVRHDRAAETAGQFKHFIRTGAFSWYFHDTLNPYNEVAELLPYQRGVLKAYEYMATKPYHKKKAPVVGLRPRTLSNAKMLNEENRALIEERFPRDIELWNALTSTTT